MTVRTTGSERGRLKVLSPKPGIRAISARVKDVSREIRVPVNMKISDPRPVKRSA